MTSPFDPEELAGVDAMSRELESLAASTTVPPTDDFVDRVMLAVDAEPLAAPAHAAGLALRRGAVGAFLAAFADAGRVALRAGFPVAVRAQAFALVLVVAALAAGSAVATAGALGFIRGGDALPPPRPPVVEPSPSADATPSEPPRPTAAPPSMEPSPSMPAEPDGTDHLATPTATPSGTDDHGGSGGGSGPGSGSGSGSGGGEDRTPKPSKTPGSGSGGGDDDGDDHGGHGGGGGHGSGSETPKPGETPKADDGGDDSGGSSGHG